MKGFPQSLKTSHFYGENGHHTSLPWVAYHRFNVAPLLKCDSACAHHTSNSASRLITERCRRCWCRRVAPIAADTNIFILAHAINVAHFHCHKWQPKPPRRHLKTKPTGFEYTDLNVTYDCPINHKRPKNYVYLHVYLVTENVYGLKLGT